MKFACGSDKWPQGYELVCLSLTSGFSGRKSITECKISEVELKNSGHSEEGR